MLVYANVNGKKRDEQFRERFIEGLNNAELIEVLLREDDTTFRETVDRAFALEAIHESIRSRPNKRADAIRVTHDAATVNSNQEVAEIKQQLKRLTDETNSLTEMMTHFISTVESYSQLGSPNQRSQIDAMCVEKMVTLQKFANIEEII